MVLMLSVSFGLVVLACSIARDIVTMLLTLSQALGSLLVFIGELVESDNTVKAGGYFVILASLLAMLR